MENIVDGDTQSFPISKQVETEGFDLQTGETWIYPTNYPARYYQYNIIQKALLKNTLVSLPTGLGKTFIAAVVMYNFYRWYPHGKIIFMAPTKPLVKQQIDACYNIMAIPSEVTAELTGAKASSARTNIWTEKRVFYVTPQVLQNDLNKIAELGSKIKCLVFDEAHRAKGNHAYCEVIRRLLTQNHKYFRVLALSATPGSNVNDVLEVIQNLLISHIEFRTEESLDVSPYVFQRSLETIVVPLSDKLIEVREEYEKVLEYYLKTLIKYKIVQGNCASMTKGRIFMIMKEYQNKNRGTSSSNYSEIMVCLNTCVTLYHAFELLIRHGLRNFLSFYDEHIEKPHLRKNIQLRCIINNVREHLGPIPNIEVLPDGTYPEIPKDIVFGHPKYYKLRDVLVSHFSQADKNTRVIVFFEYRESVMEAHTMLLQSRPLVQPKIFLGQGSGITQKIQIGVVKAFREGRCNTLLSTCIGEEGLDVGEVDLIICFDISNKSPIRMVQRMGRTGRKREGRIVVLVTEGREQQTLKDCLIHKNNISTYVLESKQLNTGMYPDSPRLVPDNLTPRCEKMFITVKKIAKKTSVKDMLKSLSSNSSGPVFSQEINILEIQERIPETTMFFNKGLAAYKDSSIVKNPIFYRFIEKQRTTQKTHRVKHSKHTRILTDLLCLADSKRFNIPTQTHGLSQGNMGKNLKQSDIRNMFFKKNSQQDFQPSQNRVEVLEDIPTQIIAKEIEDRADPSDDLNISKEVFTLLSNYLFTQLANPEPECRHCPGGFRCEDFAISTAPFLLTNNINWVPSEDILDTISVADLENFSNSLDPTYRSAADASMQLDNFTQLMDDVDSKLFNSVDFTQLENEAERNKDVIAEADRSFNFEAPKTYSNLLSKFGNSIFISQENTQVIAESDHDNSKEIAKESDEKNNNESLEISEKSLLEFFMFDSLTDVFGNSLVNSSQSTVIYSPTFSDTDENNLCTRFKSPSPILSLDERRKNIKARKNLTSQSQVSDFTGNSPVKRLLTDNNLEEDEEVSISDLNEICDLSYFGISCSKTEDIDVNKSPVADIAQICDLSQFGISDHDKVTKEDGEVFKKRTNGNADRIVNKNNNNFDNDSRLNEMLYMSQASDKKNEDIDVNKSPVVDIAQICDLSQFGISDHDKVTKQEGEVFKKRNADRIVNNNNNNFDNDSRLNEMLYMSQASDKENDYDILRSSCDMYKKASPSRKRPYSSSEFTTKVTEQNKSPVIDMDLPSVETDFDLPTQRTEFTKRSVANQYKSTFPQKSSFIDDFEESDMFAIATQPYNSNKTNILTTKNSAVDNDQTFVETDFTLPTQRTDFTKRSEANQFKTNFTQKNSFIDDFEESDVFAIATQPHNSNKTNILTTKNSAVDNDQTFVETSFTLPTQRTNLSKNGDVKGSKLNFTQKSNLIDDYKGIDVFTMSTQPSNSKSTHNINSTLRGHSLEDDSAMDKQIESLDLSLSMPTPTNEKRILSCESQIPITQMLSLLNKPSQAALNVSKDTITQPVQSPELNSGKNIWMSKLSIKKNVSKERSSIKTQLKGPPKKEVDPYLFSLNSKSNKKKAVEKGTTSSDEFEDSVFLKPVSSLLKPHKGILEKNRRKRIKRCKKKSNDFLELEAQLSDDENISDDENEEDIDYYEKSFVNDETQNFDTQMHAKYLQSVRSPANPRRFKIPIRPTRHISNVYSQPPPTEVDTYLEDSFCVDSIDDETQENELSQLEILERKLKQKKRKKSDDKDLSKLKRRRIICFPTDDSD